MMILYGQVLFQNREKTMKYGDNVHNIYLCIFDLIRVNNIYTDNDEIRTMTAVL